ncbi:hypothetical protein Patl1_15242 [Pistacia atlantica]|uniref:Uncharacterized protein n=1 Tax=Pistacia atlantica TaxID=434234 RepID=A0ACC1BAZ5_9ROSI|nr:hypothetical protein Patl1_15242 [Pistacia atlantica]
MVDSSSELAFKLRRIMKFLEYTPLDRINDFLNHLNLGERTIKGNLEGILLQAYGNRQEAISQLGARGK